MNILISLIDNTSDQKGYRILNILIDTHKENFTR